jgi:hypothetical protein
VFSHGTCIRCNRRQLARKDEEIYTAPLGMRFYTEKMFPPEYRNTIFIARHGSWNRSKKIGGIVVGMPIRRDDPDRYAARPLGAGDWFVWDTQRHEPVFGSDTLGEYQAREAARRLSQAYRRAMSRSSAWRAAPRAATSDEVKDLRREADRERTG